MKSDRPIYKVCKYCEKEFQQNEIFNHQRSCISKSKEINKSNSSKPQINAQHIQSEQQHQSFQKSSSLQNNQNFQESNVDLQLSQKIHDKYNGKIIVLGVIQLPKEDSIRYEEQQKQNIQQQQPSYERQPYQNCNQQQFSQQEAYNQKPNFEQLYYQQPQQSVINQVDVSNLIKCEHCNCLLNSEDKDFHEMNCSSVIRFQELIKDLDQPQEQEIPSQSISFIIANNQTIIAQYLQIHSECKDIIQKGKKLLDGAMFKNLKFKKTLDQKTCYFCSDYFKEDEIIYNLECCLLKSHKKCLHNMVKKSTKCYNCKKELFPFKGQVKR
ncbi:unnamed protein product (macronuclear) [Paramecium tetraurelia]|uniref:RING-type domain-containing protein n=1 Tax=Paramecium tetraurelia TaxID=5888 RepID=A0DIR6_PARTE|nr:uncharacterized protein GSPATT00017290001 [Paramecium tetraurelia]CAK82933.1 unnamed protein product [Paramecium tetraurelia]|eukprot:XP_001450330.1 hypothetical protein (macronuclear) [Paramecium tetraurelia strain d4-2]